MMRGIIPYSGSSNIESAVIFKKGDILISNIRPYLKKIWLADRDGSCSPDVLVLRVKDTSIVSSEFVFSSLRQNSFFEYMMLGKKGAKMPRADKEHVLDYELPLPRLSEQSRIVTEVFSLISKINNEEEIISHNIKKKIATLDGIIL